jgi:cytochrome c553
MNKALLVAAAIAALGTMQVAQAAGDAAAGAAKAKSCAGCHGPKGEGVGANPKLAGKPQADMAQALKDYKSGKRPNAVMKTFANGMSEQDMENVAAYYAAQK